MTSTVPHAVLRQTQPDGSIHLASRHALGPVAPESGAWLHHWANKSPERIFLAERSGAGWREHGYGEILAMVKAVAAGLIARGLDAATPIAILSGNGVDHQILSLAAQYIGIPTVPLAEQYSLIPEAHGRLAYVLNMVKPALAFVDDAAIYAGA
ncbi:MAG: AMP-binding protein, partial [Rhizobiaceae bacterium]